MGDDFSTIPRLIHQSLANNRAHELEKRMIDLLAEEKRQSRWLAMIAILLAVFLLWQVLQ